jgi:transcriptional regulator with PAS, ATPase and Fis domain
LRQAVAQGRFRTDLYYRLNVISMTVPALRDRKEDVLPLADHFIRLYNERFAMAVKGLAPEAAGALENHDWPGNVRELRNAVERAMVLEETEWIQPASLGLESNQPVVSSHGGGTAVAIDGLSLEEAEIRLLTRALEKTRGNQSRAARLLGISRDAIRYKIKKFHLDAVGISDS